MTGTMFANIAADLVAMAQQAPERAAVICSAGRDKNGQPRYQKLTFQELDVESDCIARGLLALGITPGTRTVLMVPPGLEFFKLVFALFKIGAVMVCVDPGIGRAYLKQCLAESEPQAFVGVPKAHLARRLFGWGRATNHINVVVGGAGWLWGGVSLERICAAIRSGATAGLSSSAGLTAGQASIGTLPWTRCQPEEIAAILFTSGSTGPPKGAIYTHGNFRAQVAALKDLYDIQPGEIDLATFPLFALYAPALGMTAVVPEMDFTRPADVEPRRIAEAIERFGVTNLFGSPALLDRVGNWGCEAGVRFATLKRVVSAGAPVPARVIEQFSRLLPQGVQVFTPYGATESLPVASIGSDEILADTRARTAAGQGVCVGRPVETIRVRIVAIRGEPFAQWRDDLALPASQIGEILVQGPAVSKAYYGRDEATRIAKIPDPSATHLPPEQRLWHRMGDLGYFDDRGRLWFCGRKSQRVITASGDRFTICCEGVFNAHPHVRRTALVGVSHNGTARPALCVELLPEAKSASKDIIRRELLALGADHPHTRDIHDIVFHPHFPVDIRHNAKIDREKLSDWASHKIHG